jgi:hypothetical protein
MRGRAHAAGLFVLVAALSCSPEDGETEAARSTEPVARAPASEAPSTPARTEAALPEPPGRGEVVIVPADGTITVLANQVLISDLLSRLARAADFELLLSEFADRPVDVFAVGATLGDVLAQALEGVPYIARYGARDGRSRLVLVAVGEGSEDAVASVEDPRTDETASEPGEKGKKEGEGRDPARTARRADPVDPAQRARFRAARAEREAARRAETLGELDSPDAETRRDAVQMLDADIPADVDRLARILGSDEDYRVRVAAIEQLEFADSSLAAETITGALSDPQAEVILAAVKALRIRPDPRAAPRLKPLLEHANPEVRDQAKALVELLEDGEPAR